MRKLTPIGFIACVSFLLVPISALAQFTTQQGGTGTTSPSGILYGDSTLHLKTLGIGAGCSFAAGTLTCTGSGSSYPFPLTGNATSTLTQFNGGLTAYGTSTIGAGGQTTGLTISGGATTTGNAYFAGLVGVQTTNPTAFDAGAKLAVAGDIVAQNPQNLNKVSSYNTSTGGTVTFSINDTYGQMLTTTNHPFALGAANSLLQYITVGGAIGFGIGTTNSRVQSTFVTIAGTTTTSLANALDVQNSNFASLFRVRNDGNIGIGTTSPLAQLTVATPDGATGATTNLFLIASSTALATTTLFSVSNTGALSAASGNFVVTNLGSATLTNASQGPTFTLAGNNAVIGTTGGDLTIANQDNTTRSIYFAIGSTAINNGNNRLAVLNHPGNFGIGTTTPFGKFGILLNSTDTAYPSNNAFIIASSTASATTTLFSVDNTGVVFTTLTNGCVQAASGVLTSTGSSCGSGGGGTFPFTPFADGNSTSTLTLFTKGASTTLLSVFDRGYFGGTSTTTIFGNGATSTFRGSVAISTTSPTALSVQDQYGGAILTTNTASTTADILDVASSTGTNYLSVTQTGLVSMLNASTSLFSVFTKSYFGGTSTTTFDSAGNEVIPSGSGLTITGKSDGCATFASGVLNSTGSACGSGGGGTYSFTPSTDGGINTSATSTPIQGTHPGLGLDISNTSWYGIGGNLLAYASSTNNDTVFGQSAGGNNATTSATSGRVVAVGKQALSALTTGTDVTAVGYQAGLSLQGGQRNTYFGATAGSANISSADNTFIGYQTGVNVAGAVVTNGKNTAVGSGALAGGGGASTQTENVAIGYQVGSNMISGYDNIFIGQTLNAGGGNLSTGGGNILIGYNTLPRSTSDSFFFNIGNSFFGTIVATTTSTTFTLPVTGNSFSVGSSSPFAKLSVHVNNGDTSTSLFVLASSTATATTTLFKITNTGHKIASSTTPTLTSCGTTPSMVGDDTHGEITIGSVSATGCTITFANAWTVAPICTISNQAMSITSALTYTITNIAITLSQATGFTGDKIDYICEGLTGQ